MKRSLSCAGWICASGLSCLPFKAIADAVPSIKKVMVVIFENTDYSAALAQPFFAKIAQEGVLFTNFDAEAHPSQGNYIALTSGDLNGVTGDGNTDLNVRNIADLVEAKGLTWKSYVEDYPGNCFLGASSGNYARKHVPFLSYTDIQSSPQRCAKIVPATALAADIANDQVPNFSLYIPNLKNDGHDTGVAYADRWFKGAFEPLIQNQNLMRDLLLVVTFDESGGIFGRNQIYTALIGEHVIPGKQYTDKANHFDLLRTIEDGLGIGNLGKKDSTAKSFTNIWQ